MRNYLNLTSNSNKSFQLERLLPTLWMGDSASTSKQENEPSQGLRWDLAAVGTDQL